MRAFIVLESNKPFSIFAKFKILVVVCQLLLLAALTQSGMLIRVCISCSIFISRIGLSLLRKIKNSEKTAKRRYRTDRN